MSHESIIIELLVRWDDNQSLTAEELCREYSQHPEYAVLLEGVRQGKRDMACLECFLATSYEDGGGSPVGLPVGTPPAPSAALPVTWRGDPSQAPLSPGAPAAPRVRYRMVMFHKGGGLGEVWKANDQELGRDVALKRIKEEHRGKANYDDYRRSFLREAEITAKLEHPGVVPVHGLVYDTDGQPCYAMRFIGGATLAEAIKQFHEADRQPRRDPGERSLTLRNLLNRFIAVCNTVAYAHTRGILHRDLKTSNIMLGNYGETLVVDWGLAKLFQRTEKERTTGEQTLESTLDDSSQPGTQPGDVKGTPAYMSPEQAHGHLDELGPASDIFSLGATLYAILTGAPPYPSNSVLAARRCEFRPPRQLNPSIARALEAICLKALAIKPEDRYATAQELGADVDRWLGDQPVRAWREPWTLTARRWLGRHRTLVTSAAATLVVAVLSLAGLAAMLTVHNKVLAAANSRERDARLQADQQKEVADQQRDQARNHFSLVGNLYSQIGRSSSAVSALEKARAATQRLVQEHPQVPEYRQLALHSQFNLGKLYRDAGRTSDAEMAYDATFADATRWAKDYPEEPFYLAMKAHTLTSLGNLYSGTKGAKDAERAYRQALAIRQRLADEHPDEPKYQYELSLSHSNLGTLYLDNGPSDKSEAAYQEAKDRQQRLVKTHPHESDFHAELANTYYNLGLLYAKTNQLKKAEESDLTALAMRQQLVKAFPSVGEHLSDLASSHNNLGTLYRETKRLDQAIKALEEVVRIRQGLVKAFPGMPAYQAELATGYHNLAFLYQEKNRLEEAESTYKQGLRIQETLTFLQPLSVEYQLDLAQSHNSLGTLYMETKRLAEAETNFSQAGKTLDRLVNANGGNLDAANELGNTFGNLGSVSQLQSKPACGVAWYLRAMRTFEGVLARDPQNAYARESLKTAQFAKGMAVGAAGSQPPADAVKDWERAMEIAPQLDRGFCCYQRARALVRLGDHAQAVTEVMALVRGKASKDVTLYDLACVCSLAAAAVARDAKLPAEERRRLAESYGAQTVTLLRQAATAGFFKAPGNFTKLKKASDLDGVRPREDFKKLMAELNEQSP